MVEELTNNTFDEFVKEGIVLIDFYADWCMPCVMMGPIVEDISEKFKGKIKVGKANVEDNEEIAKKFNVSSIPNFVLLKEGNLIEQFSGGMTEEELENKINSHL